MAQLQRKHSTTKEKVTIAVVVLLLAAGGVWIYQRNNNPVDTTKQSATRGAAETDAPEIEDMNDLEAAERALDDTDIEAVMSDGDELDSQTQDF